MLTCICLSLALGQIDAPASADAAVWRARLAGMTRHDVRRVDEQALLETPIANVNGNVIHLREPIHRYHFYLQDARTRLTPEAYASVIHQLVARDLPRQIDLTLLVQAAEQEFGAERLEQVQTLIERQWQEVALPELARELSDPTSRATLDAAHLDLCKQNWMQERLANEYLFSQSIGSAAARQKYLDGLRQKADIRTAYLLTGTGSIR
ncbi:hypothetical protein GC163_06835 [bacterium]|nr:hypothetical protein [bacterium]